MVALVSRTGRLTQRYCSDGCQCRQVVGCVPYRYKTVTREDGTTSREIEVLVIRSQKGQGLMFPKGGWELDETMEQAAQRETREEAGVAGVLDRVILGKWCYKGKTNGISHEGYMYPLLVTDQSETWPEKNTRIRVWMKVDEAKGSNMPSWMKQALEALILRLQTPLRSNVQIGATCDLDLARKVKKTNPFRDSADRILGMDKLNKKVLRTKRRAKSRETRKLRRKR